MTNFFIIIFNLKIGIFLPVTTPKQIPPKNTNQNNQIILNSKEEIKLKVKYNTTKDAYILSWKSNSDSDYFLVQKCTDNVRFKTITKYYKNKKKKYYHKDIISSNEIVYYKITSVNKFGKSSFSNTMKILNKTTSN
ncbi:hypothetical protein [Lacihabitans lacunae]|uniref:Fibronectin type-III domain-containing protein n=1 Tax=Lacihabitans lacunae TaxID=1028214 RepID=A0ABV7Z2E1_9BACT